MSSLTERLRAVESHPLHRYMGVGKIEAGGGRSRIAITLGEASVNTRGLFHGGVAYTIADMACYCALLSELGEDEDAATTDIHAALLRTAHTGAVVVATASVLKRGRSVAFMEAEIRSGEELLAKVTVTKAILRTRG